MPNEKSKVIYHLKSILREGKKFQERDIETLMQKSSPENDASSLFRCYEVWGISTIWSDRP